jgi:hypothetical protein
MEDVDKFYVHLVYFTAICNILLPFGNLVVICYVCPRFGIFYQQKSGNPAADDIFKVIFGSVEDMTSYHFLTGNVFFVFVEENLESTYD